MDIKVIQELCSSAPFQMTQHAEMRRRQRGISIPDIRQAIMSGSIIEEYPNDFPYPSCLILGHSTNRTPIHLVCGVGESVLFVITAYKPSAEKWEVDLKTRKEP